MELKYYYNSTNKEFIITNGKCNSTGFKKITKERYDELQEELNKASEETEATE